MRLKTLTLLLLLAILPLIRSEAQDKKLSETAKISLLTCGPGEAIWSKFGHSALWVFDAQAGIDKVYNYGTFDFYSSDFYFEFIRGTANYRLSITDYLRFYQEYESENRSILMQELNLTSGEKQILFEKLEENYKPENRYYRYDFLFQNCSSLIRDIVWEATSGRFTIPEESEEKHTYRSMMIPYLSSNPWLMNGEFILLGHQTDLSASPWDQMYLPDYMFNWFESARDANNESLVLSTHSLFLPRPSGPQSNFFSHPVFIMGVILLLVIFLTITEIRRKTNFPFADALIFLVAGLLGILIIYMWCCSKHLVTHQNLNLFWAFPLHFLLVIFVWIKKARPIVRIYARVMAPVTIFFLCFFWILPQAFPSAAIFSSAIVAVRLISLGYLKK